MALSSCPTSLLSKAQPQFPSSFPFPGSNAQRPLHPLNPSAWAFSTCRRSGKKWVASQAPREEAQPPNQSKFATPTTLAGALSSFTSSSSPPASAPSEPEITPAATVVRDFYDGINRRDLASVAPLVSEGCVYEDLIFSRPFVGRQAILEFFKKFINSISSDLQFVIDEISSEDSSAVGVTWHLEWRGRPFPFSKGCSFYLLEVLDDRRQIVYGRDCVEPAIKPGDMALVLIRGVTSVLQQFQQLADRF